MSRQVTTPTAQAIDLSGQGLAQVPAYVWERSDLTLLNLYRNELTAVPPDISRLGSLEVLILANNRLCALPAELGTLSRVRTLDLGHNRLAHVPDELGLLAGLTDYLYLHDNLLRTQEATNQPLAGRGRARLTLLPMRVASPPRPTDA